LFWGKILSVTGEGLGDRIFSDFFGFCLKDLRCKGGVDRNKLLAGWTTSLDQIGARPQPYYLYSWYVTSDYYDTNA